VHPTTRIVPPKESKSLYCERHDNGYSVVPWMRKNVVDQTQSRCGVARSYRIQQVPGSLSLLDTDYIAHSILVDRSPLDIAGQFVELRGNKHCVPDQSVVQEIDSFIGDRRSVHFAHVFAYPLIKAFPSWRLQHHCGGIFEFLLFLGAS